eukprot:678436-Pelagomonas_calceolata.AAC.1
MLPAVPKVKGTDCDVKDMTPPRLTGSLYQNVIVQSMVGWLQEDMSSHSPKHDIHKQSCVRLNDTPCQGYSPSQTRSGWSFDWLGLSVPSNLGHLDLIIPARSKTEFGR